MNTPEKPKRRIGFTAEESKARNIENQKIKKLRALRGKLYWDDNLEKLSSLDIQEKRAVYGKTQRLARESKKLNRKEEQTLADEGLQAEVGTEWRQDSLFDSKTHPFYGMRKNDKRSVKQVMKELRKPRYHDL
jgi:hypothetical protein